ESEFFEGRELEILALGRSIGTGEKEITAEVIEVKNFDELKERQKEVKGKIVFFSRPHDMGTVNTFQGYGDAVNQRSQGAIEAAKFGAVGVLIRSVTTKHDNVPHTGSMNNYVDSLPEIPAASLGFLDADFLSDALKKDSILKLKMKLNCKTLPDILSYNVIADYKGTEKSDEIIVVAGHFDSWDAGCGAHDDGGGCIQAFEVLDLFKRLSIKPKRTIRCIFYINEENGVKGGIEYGNYADTTREKHIAAIESDRGVFTPVGFAVTSDSLTLIKLQNWLPILEYAGIEWIKAGGSGVDISQIKNTQALIGFVPDDQRYFDLHHSANDVFEEVHPREMELGAAAIAVMAFLLSEEL
ncbi:MAG: peptidase M28, partial [Ignavibacteria bacterium RBG_16_34_14]